MKIGLLQAESHSIEIETQFGSYSRMFQRLFHQVDDQLSFNVYSVIKGHYPDSLNDCDAYLITGSKESVYNDIPWIETLRQFIRDGAKNSVKFIGICFGHQLIADVLGGRVEKADQGWGVGVAENDIIESNSWMHPALKKFSLLVSHQDQVVQLPDNAHCFARSQFCPYAGFRIGRHILCFQGHPEFEVGYLEERMTMRREIIGESRYISAVQSLNLHTQHLEITRWMVNFMRANH